MYGLHNNALEWFKSYLNLRTQKTFISGEQSTPGKSCSRRATWFCPRHDTIFDLHQLVMSHSFADIFADDTTLSTYNKSLDVVVTLLTNDLAHVVST